MKFEEDENFYAYVNSDYMPEKLGRLIDALNPRSNLTAGSVRYEELNHTDEFRSYEFTGLEPKDVWRMPLSDTSKAAEEYDYRSFETLMSISVDAPLLGYEHVSLSATSDDYLATNILDTGKAFLIGTDKVSAFKKYVYDHCAGRQIIYIDNDGEGIQE